MFINLKQSIPSSRSRRTKTRSPKGSAQWGPQDDDIPGAGLQHKGHKKGILHALEPALTPCFQNQDANFKWEASGGKRWEIRIYQGHLYFSEEHSLKLPLGSGLPSLKNKINECQGYHFMPHSAQTQLSNYIITTSSRA